MPLTQSAMYLSPHTTIFGKGIRGFKRDAELFVIGIESYFVGEQAGIDFRSRGQHHKRPYFLSQRYYTSIIGNVYNHLKGNCISVCTTLNETSAVMYKFT